MKKMELERKKS
jgi:ABC-type multidrug transport system fused ATPase/permease subunit